jgi:hypothetical protein
MAHDLDLVDYNDKHKGRLRSIFRTYEELSKIWECSKALNNEWKVEVWRKIRHWTWHVVVHWVIGMIVKG